MGPCVLVKGPTQVTRPISPHVKTCCHAYSCSGFSTPAGCQNSRCVQPNLQLGPNTSMALSSPAAKQIIKHDIWNGTSPTMSLALSASPASSVLKSLTPE